MTERLSLVAGIHPPHSRTYLATMSVDRHPMSLLHARDDLMSANLGDRENASRPSKRLHAKPAQLVEIGPD